MNKSIAWPLTLQDGGEKWIVEEVITPSLFKIVKECDSEEKVFDWMAARNMEERGEL